MAREQPTVLLQMANRQTVSQLALNKQLVFSWQLAHIELIILLGTVTLFLEIFKLI